MTKRWMAENTYRNGDAPTVVQFEELADLHDVVEMWADWNEMRRSFCAQRLIRHATTRGNRERTLTLQQLRQLGDVGGNPPGLVAREGGVQPSAIPAPSRNRRRRAPVGIADAARTGGAPIRGDCDLRHSLGAAGQSSCLKWRVNAPHLHRLAQVAAILCV
jgi:hypothetical protein